MATINGSSWSAPVSIGAGIGDGAVSCASPSFCADVGGGSASESADTFTGGAWKGPANIGGGDNNLESVSCVSSEVCVAVGESAKGGFAAPRPRRLTVAPRTRSPPAFRIADRQRRADWRRCSSAARLPQTDNCLGVTWVCELAIGTRCGTAARREAEGRKPNI